MNDITYFVALAADLDEEDIEHEEFGMGVPQASSPEQALRMTLTFPQIQWAEDALAGNPLVFRVTDAKDTSKFWLLEATGYLEWDINEKEDDD